VPHENGPPTASKLRRAMMMGLDNEMKLDYHATIIRMDDGGTCAINQY